MPQIVRNFQRWIKLHKQNQILNFLLIQVSTVSMTNMYIHHHLSLSLSRYRASIFFKYNFKQHVYWDSISADNLVRVEYTRIEVACLHYAPCYCDYYAELWLVIILSSLDTLTINTHRERKSQKHIHTSVHVCTQRET